MGKKQKNCETTILKCTSYARLYALTYVGSSRVPEHHPGRAASKEMAIRQHAESTHQMCMAITPLLEKNEFSLPLQVNWLHKGYKSCNSITIHMQYW